VRTCPLPGKLVGQLEGPGDRETTGQWTNSRIGRKGDGLSRKNKRARPPVPPPAAQAPPPAVGSILKWGTVRTALALFAVGWILVQAASVFLLLLRRFGPELQPAAEKMLNLVSALAFGVGLVYFVTGMCLTCAVPAESGAKRLAWGIIGCLIVSGAAWLLFNGAASENQEIVREIDREILAAQRKNPRAGPPSKAKLERELERQWGQDTLKGLIVTAVGAFCLGKLLFSAFLWQLARHFRHQRLAGGILIYLLAEGFWAAVTVSILIRQPGQRGIDSPLVLFTASWLPVAALSAFCAWFLVNLFLVRRAIIRALLGPGG
jgi:hypothetical protein